MPAIRSLFLFLKGIDGYAAISYFINPILDAMYNITYFTINALSAREDDISGSGPLRTVEATASSDY